VGATEWARAVASAPFKAASSVCLTKHANITEFSLVSARQMPRRSTGSMKFIVMFPAVLFGRLIWTARQRRVIVR